MAIKVKLCKSGTARGKSFYLAEQNKRFTECRPCDEGTYQMTDGRDRCDSIPPGKTSNEDR